jgi:hypothetical protein
MEKGNAICFAFSPFSALHLRHVALFASFAQFAVKKASNKKGETDLTFYPPICDPARQAGSTSTF